jgi:hypothetical protein
MDLWGMKSPERAEERVVTSPEYRPVWYEESQEGRVEVGGGIWTCGV